MAAGFGSGVSDTLVVDQSQMARLSHDVEAPHDEEVQAFDDASGLSGFGLFDDDQNDNDPLDLLAATAPSPVAAPVAAREGDADLTRIFLDNYFEAPGAAAPVAAPVPAAAAPAPAPPEAPVAMTPAQAAGELAALGVPIDEAAAAGSLVLLPLLGIARAAAEAARAEAGQARIGKWLFPEEEIADLLVDALRRRRLPLRTGAIARVFLAKVLSCSPGRIGK